jgi:hypothetical protein
MSTAIMAMVLLCFYWIVIDRAVPVVVHGGQVLKYEKQPDGSWIVFVKWTGEQFRLCDGNSKRWLADTAILPLADIPYPPNESERPLGPYQWEVPLHIPSYFASTGHVRGTYRIQILYACNPLQQYVFPIVVNPPPVPFELPIEQLYQRP